MACFKVSVFILLVAVSLGYFYGGKLHSFLSHEQLQLFESFIPRKLLNWMHTTTRKGLLGVNR